MMKNRDKLKKLIGIELAVIAFFLAVFSAMLYYQYRAYTANFNSRIGAVVGKIQEKYPRIKEREIAELLNGKEGDGSELLRKYGIDLEKDSVILENDSKFRTFVLVDGAVLLVAFFICLALFLKFNQGKDKEIEKITSYLEEINRGNYQLDISDNSEENLSILKNELYKTTVMLNEVAENSVKDKVKLKDSLSDISHQLKTPLTSIMIMLDALSGNEQMEESTRKEFIRDIKREINATKFLVEALLKLSKLDSNTVRFSRQAVGVEELLNEAVKNVEILGELKNASIEVSGSAEKKVFCDFKWQVEAVTNVIKNCIEHSEEFGEIRIQYAENSIYTEIRIRDFGLGIEPEDLPHIFERFYKGQNSGGDSVGIGLALAKAIVEKDNGYIRVDSKAGEGSTFRILYFR